ncbi:DUF4386 domain-containing protein [Pseudoduganella chitinolytica]|uniref:DUF4386 domain-containing protein n=1 Tax=Pseudoduganella chitinolytica TaxID=34070 RepID=A0ABY8B4Z5_9BURK|nr:DUF4386 domain-containing protein [Pseudoduganella chitinolytica]WEF31017.1 DUF4386 domain-containing protein [Pseudoduganella chitinolytica]
MKDERTTGQWLGVTMLGAMASAICGYFVLLAPVFDGPGFLAGAAVHDGRVRAGVLLVLLSALLPLAGALALWPLLRGHGERLALALTALAVAALAVSVVEQGLLLAMLSLSQAHAAASDPAAFQPAYAMAAGARYAVHYLALLMSGATSLTLYTTFFHARLLPRILAACGMAAVALQMAAVLLHLAGQPFHFTLVAPAALCQLATGLWLLARGLRRKTSMTLAHAA